jgi:hypothetical protein
VASDERNCHVGYGASILFDTFRAEICDSGFEALGRHAFRQPYTTRAGDSAAILN